jgi:hypothetical protein
LGNQGVTELAAVVDLAYPRHCAAEALVDRQLLLRRSRAIRGYGAQLNLLPEHKDGHFLSLDEEYCLTSVCQLASNFESSSWIGSCANAPRTSLNA